MNVDAVDTQRVGAAVHLATRRAVSEMVTVGNRQALELSIGRRLQGTYGAELRALAGQDPNLSVAELAEQVIFAAEYPDDIPEASIYSGERDKARRAQPNAPSPNDGWPEGKLCENLTGWREGIARAKAALTEPVRRDPKPPKPISDELASEMAKAREALVAGREIGAMDRKSRRERMSKGAA